MSEYGGSQHTAATGTTALSQPRAPLRLNTKDVATCFQRRTAPLCFDTPPGLHYGSLGEAAIPQELTSEMKEDPARSSEGRKNGVLQLSHRVDQEVRDMLNKRPVRYNPRDRSLKGNVMALAAYRAATRPPEKPVVTKGDGRIAFEKEQEVAAALRATAEAANSSSSFGPASSAATLSKDPSLAAPGNSTSGLRAEVSGNAAGIAVVGVEPISQSGTEAPAQEEAKITLQPVNGIRLSNTEGLNPRILKVLNEPQARGNQIAVLALTGCRIGPEGAEAIAPFIGESTVLTRLDVSGNRLGEEGCRSLARGVMKSKSLKNLDISFNSINDQGCSVLVNAILDNFRCAISYMNLSTNDLGASAGYHIGHLIRDHRKLESLLLWRNRLGITTAISEPGIVTVFEEFAASKTMKLLDVSYNNIEDAEALGLFKIQDERATRREQEKDSVRRLRLDIEVNGELLQDMEEGGLYTTAQQLQHSSLHAKITAQKRQLESEESMLYDESQTEEEKHAERVKQVVGKELVLHKKRNPRLVLTGNHGITKRTQEKLKRHFELDHVSVARAATFQSKYSNVLKRPTRGVRDPEVIWEHYEKARNPPTTQTSSAASGELDAAATATVRFGAVIEADDDNVQEPPLAAPENLVGVLKSSAREESPKASDREQHESLPETADSDEPGEPLAETSVPAAEEDEALDDGSSEEGKSEDERKEEDAASEGSLPSGAPSEREHHLEEEEQPQGDAMEEAEEASVEENLFDNVAAQEPSGFDFDQMEADAEARAAAEQAEEEAFRAKMEAHQQKLKEQAWRKEASLLRKEGSMSKRPGSRPSSAKVGSRPSSAKTSPKPPELPEVPSIAHAPMAISKETTPVQQTPPSAVVPEEPQPAVTAHEKERLVPTPPPEAPSKESSSGEVGALEASSSQQLKPSQSKALEQEEDPRTAAAKAVNASIADLFAKLEVIRELEEMGSPSDEDLLKRDKEREVLAQMKGDLSKLMESSTKSRSMPIEVERVEGLRDQVEELVVLLINDGDNRPNNLQLFESFLGNLNIDWVELIEQRDLIVTAVADGSMQYLQSMLAVPDIRMDSIDTVSAACFNQTCRIPLVRLLLRHSSVIKLEDVYEDLKETVQEFFEDIASKKKAIPREDRAARMELISTLLNHPIIQIDLDAERGDCQTVFSRAAGEDDVELMTMLQQSGKVDVNRVQGDRTTAIIQAVYTNSINAVEWLAKVPNINVKHKGPNGTALDVATGANRHARIIAALKNVDRAEARSAANAKPSAKKAKPGGKKTKKK